MLRSLGIRYVFVHPDDYDAASIAAGLPDRTIRALRDSGQVAKEAGLPRVTAFELTPWDPPAGADAPMTLIPPGELTASASESADRIPNLFDGDRDTRWIAGIGGQDGSSWLRVALTRPADVARVELQIAERSIGDYRACCASRARTPPGARICCMKRRHTRSLPRRSSATDAIRT